MRDPAQLTAPAERAVGTDTAASALKIAADIVTRVVALKPNVIDLGESPAAAGPPRPPEFLEDSQPTEQPALSPLWLSLQLLRGVLVLAKSAALAPVAAQLTAALDVLARLLRIRAPLLHASVVLLAVHVLRGTAVVHSDRLAQRRTHHALHATLLYAWSSQACKHPRTRRRRPSPPTCRRRPSGSCRYARAANATGGTRRVFIAGVCPTVPALGDVRRN